MDFWDPPCIWCPQMFLFHPWLIKFISCDSSRAPWAYDIHITKIARIGQILLIKCPRELTKTVHSVARTQSKQWSLICALQAGQNVVKSNWNALVRVAHHLNLMEAQQSLLISTLNLIQLRTSYFQEQVFREVVVVTKSSIFVKCRFEDCQETESGALVSSGSNELVVEQTDFLRCSSKTKCAGLKKENGKLLMDCCLLKECHGKIDNDIFGTAMGSSNCDAKILDTTFLMCWKAASPYADSVYGLYKGTADINGINCSRCISRGGGLAGSLNEVESGVELRYIQGVQSEEHNAFEAFQTEHTINYMNIINNTFTHRFFNAYQTKLTVISGCFFKNDCYNNYGTVELINCISDGLLGATFQEDISTIKFDVNECRTSRRFTQREDKNPLLIVMVWLLMNLAHLEIST